mmetsp:Transcript_35494/g.58140  ORF Transcript_35494/g.58140 Transcript_35494/m.58140 type:complete len:404 (+) Transcript_35494:36-1247(+)|eukprot:CAMPEP_0202686734 /NCGR_PEP_ID=MMETSP1385-20130828/2497_1 /ASSEMBLY_ACC=CAM_ASM_000861 /TAXON_ID=933848 /ORGANISM="Elphidium margaritaceum" /LENGTH=403 /DNA_ID=CAMNT_0049341381 /DNA_START=18 /DNA_END=1229 /DNA_ORIENTATION=+
MAVSNYQSLTNGVKIRQTDDSNSTTTTTTTTPASTKNILLTGGAGFIGSRCAIYLVNKYPSYNVIVIDNLSYSANIKHLRSIEGRSNFKFIHGSITSKDLVRYIFTEYRINVVIHFAAETHVDHSFRHAFEFTETNVMGTHILLECARRAYQEQNTLQSESAHSSFELFVHISTDEVYGESKMDDTYEAAKKETDVLMPTNPYSASKAAAEQMVHAYSHSFKLPIIVTRSSNVYGPHQFPEKMIPKFIYLIHSGKPVCIYGDGKNTRIYIHVDDMCNAFDVILHKGVIGEIYNITSDDEFNTVEVVQQLLPCFSDIKKTDYSQYISFVKDRPFHDTRYYMNGDKMKTLGWKPKVTFRDGLKQTVDWYLTHCQHWKNLSDVLVAHPTEHHDDNSFYGGDQRQTK